MSSNVLKFCTMKETLVIFPLQSKIRRIGICLVLGMGNMAGPRCSTRRQMLVRCEPKGIHTGVCSSVKPALYVNRLANHNPASCRHVPCLLSCAVVWGFKLRFFFFFFFPLEFPNFFLPVYQACCTYTRVIDK
jgi:hypothetical protein